MDSYNFITGFVIGMVSMYAIFALYTITTFIKKVKKIETILDKYYGKKGEGSNRVVSELIGRELLKCI